MTRLFGPLLLVFLAGCGGPSARPEKVWGRHGTQAGDFIRPRAIAIDAQDRLYVVDFAAHIQVFDREGKCLKDWFSPDYRNGRPSGMSIDRDGNLLVSDSHYHQLRVYTPEGVELRTLTWEAGSEPGQVSYLSDAVQDADGNYFVAEMCANQRISKFDGSGKFLQCWGENGTEPGQFGRIRALAFGPDGNLYVADATNHRIQVFTRGGHLVRCWGQEGAEPGQLAYPYDLAFNKKGELYIVEYGNHRVQKFTADGKSLGVWGGPGLKPGLLQKPWALAVDSRGRVHVLDTGNHRVQRIAF